MTTTDNAIADLGLDHVNFMKIDVEGAELLVLQGASHSLKAKAIDSLAFEFESANIYSRVFFRDFWDLLTDHGYSLSAYHSGRSPYSRIRIQRGP